MEQVCDSALCLAQLRVLDIRIGLNTVCVAWKSLMSMDLGLVPPLPPSSTTCLPGWCGLQQISRPYAHSTGMFRNCQKCQVLHCGTEICILVMSSSASLARWSLRSSAWFPSLAVPRTHLQSRIGRAQPLRLLLFRPLLISRWFW